MTNATNGARNFGLDAPAREKVDILLVEGNALDAQRMTELVGAAPGLDAACTHAPSFTEARRILEGRAPRRSVDVVLIDVSLDDARGVDALAELQRLAPGAAIVVLTGVDGVDDEAAALGAMAAGAEDYLVKSRLDAGLLARAVRYAVQRKRADEGTRVLLRAEALCAQAEASERRARFLADAAGKLAEALEYEVAFATAAELVVAAFGDACVVDAFEEGGVRRAAARAREGLEPWAAEAMGQAPDQTVLDVLRTRAPALCAEAPARLVVPLVARGRVLGAVTVVSTDVARRYTDDDLSFAVDLAGRVALAIDNAKLFRAREDMLSVVSHDLRNPLNVIGFAVASLRKTTLSDEQRSGYLQKIRRASERMNRLIQDLLDVTRLEGGSITLEAVAQPSMLLLQEAVDHLRPLADEKGVRLVTEASSGLPKVTADRERVLQVFGNLVGNALKFTPEGGTVTLSAAAGAGEVVFSVRDTGPGIEPENLVRIFDRFFQARRRDRQGAGLGLAIARGLVIAHGGRLWVESRPGEGSTFHVALPVATAESARTAVARDIRATA